MNKLKLELVLIVFGLLAYANAIAHPFVHDDIVFIQQNPHITQFDLKSIFLSTATPDHQGSLINAYYRPLLEIIYRIEYKLFQLNPYGYHFFNIVVHIINSLLVFACMNIISRRKRNFSFVIAILFLLHPVQTEAVACISGISNLIYALFCLLAFYLYLKRGEASSLAQRSRLYFCSLLTFFMALLAKEQAIVMPFLILIYELSLKRMQKNNLTKVCGLWFGYAFVLGGYFLMRKVIVGSSVLDSLKFNGEFWLRILAIPKTLLMYVSIILFPKDLHYYRSVDILQPYLYSVVILGVVLLVVFLILKSIHQSRRRILFFGLGWFLVTLFPTLNILPLINEYSFILTAEHFLYLPLLGVLIFVVGCANVFFEKVKINQTVVLSLVIMLFFVLTIRQNTYWKNEIVLFERVLQFQKLGRVHTLLANAYHKDGRYYDAIQENQKALEIMEGYIGKVENPGAKDFYRGFKKRIHFELAQSYVALEEFVLSLKQYQYALELDSNNGFLHNNIGINYLRIKDYASARRHFERAVALNPKDVIAKNNLAMIHLEKKDFSKAIGLFEEILVINPQFLPARQNLEKLLSIQ